VQGQIQELKESAVKLTGYPIKYAFYGGNILGYLMGNDTLKAYLQNQQQLNLSVAKSEIPTGLLGLVWQPVSEACSQLAAGFNTWFDGDTIVFTPEPDLSWYELIEGSTPVPSDIGTIEESGVRAIGNVTLASGLYTFATVETDPTSIKQVGGDIFLPIIKVPKSVFIADVTP